MRERLLETSPTTGEFLAEHEVPDDAEVEAAVARSRQAWAGGWGRTAVGERRAPLRRLRGLLVEDADRIVAAVGRTTGKVPTETLGSEVLSCVDLLHFHDLHAEGILAPEPRESTLLFGLSSFHVEYSPLGVVAILSPWNYPLQLSLVPVVTALAAGNCVVLKPSELTPSIGVLIADLCERAGFPEGVVQVLVGGPRVGRALVAARPDLVFFTGSVATGKKVLASAAENLTPVVLELGGKDPMIVFDDANLQRAVAAAVYGAFTNAGQTCVAVERCYVESPAYERFVEAAAAATTKLRVGPDGDIGPIISPAQIGIIDEHVDDALSKGAVLATERRREGSFYHPLVLREVDHRMRIMTEETFGPVLPIMPFRSEDEAIALANGSIYGLNASVFTADRQRGSRVASAIVAGSCAVNDVLKNIANPYTPFGGEKHSGLGRTHGPEGLRSFSRTKAVMLSSGRGRSEVNWFPYTAQGYAGLKAVLRALHGDRHALARAGGFLSDLLRLPRIK